MTTLLRQAVEAVERLPVADQDAIAARLLAEVEDERMWTERFAATSEPQWAAMADAVRREIAAGRTRSLPRGGREDRADRRTDP